MMVLPERKSKSYAAVVEPLLELDPVVCRDCIGTSAMRFEHHLYRHPLLELDALAMLADSLPSSKIECLDRQDSVVAPGGEPLRMKSPGEAVRGLEASGQWMVMKNVERNPDYLALLTELLDQVATRLPAREGRMTLREAFMFLSAPGAITPVHIDPEHNLLLHVKGNKAVSVGRFVDLASEQRAIRRYLSGAHRNLVDMPIGFVSHDLQPGNGLYMPPWRPHWVKNGASLSISLSIAFRTRLSERYEFANMINGKLERRGLSPRLAGESPSLDKCKAAIVRAKRWLISTR